jgi:hypothetical protein
MKLKRLKMKVKAILALLIATQSFAGTVIGKAYKADRLEYTEKRNEYDGRNYTAEYSDASGKLFAKKKVTYPKAHPWAPIFTLEDIRHDYKLEVTPGGKGVKVKLKKNGEIKTGTFEVSKSSIWDAGIHYFIIDNWEKLKTTQTREVFIPELMRFVEFDFTRDKNNVVEMKISNTLLSWFVDPIYVEYDQDKTMRKYNGISDINDAKMEQLSVVIYYSYPN